MTDYVRPHRANIMSQNRDAETIKKTGRRLITIGHPSDPQTKTCFVLKTVVELTQVHVNDKMNTYVVFVATFRQRLYS